jgi:arylsulfatase A-like enzyme
MIQEVDPDFTFVNLGDIDRMGHSDLTGTTLQAARSAALADTDLQVGRLVDTIKAAQGRWESSLLVLLADHSMDWSRPDRIVTLAPLFDASPLLAGNVEIAGNGGADLLYWTGPAADRAAAVAEMRRLALGHPGVLEAYDVAATPWLRLGPEAGEVVVWCRSGWRLTDPSVTSNPIPGNHGHPATYPIPFLLSGGHPLVPAGTASPVLAATVDVAPTVGAFFGVAAPVGGWDGTSRL